MSLLLTLATILGHIIIWITYIASIVWLWVLLDEVVQRRGGRGNHVRDFWISVFVFCVYFYFTNGISYFSWMFN